MKVFHLFILIALIGFVQPVQAQELGNQFIATEPTLEFNPSFPEPGDTVVVTLNDQGVNGGGATVNWYLNGAAQAELKNQRSIEYTAGELGESDSVRAVLVFPNSSSLSVDAEREATYLDVVLEPNTYVPPFYKGRPLPSNGSEVRATALLSRGDTVSAAEYSYRWSIDNTVLEGGPIRGGRSITFTVPIRTSHRLKLEIFDLDGNLVGYHSQQLPIVKPQLEFYEYNSLTGLRPMALSANVPFTNSALSLEAAPYYLDNDVFLTNSIFEWKLNNRVVNNGNPLRITLDQTDGANNRAQVDFRASSLENFLQNTRGGITVGSSPLPF